MNYDPPFSITPQILNAVARISELLGALEGGLLVNRRYRNRRIGEFLKELDLTEGRSTGIPKILRNMAANGSPVPEFETDDDLVCLPVHPQAEVATVIIHKKAA